MKEAQRKMESIKSMGEAGETVYKISRFLAFPALIAGIVGCVFCVICPNRHGAFALAIAALSALAVYVVLVVIFEFIPAAGGKTHAVHDRMLFAFTAGKHSPGQTETRRAGRTIINFGTKADNTGAKVLSLLMDELFAAVLILVPLFMAAVAQAKKDKQHRKDCMLVMWLAVGFASALLLQYIFLFIDWDIKPEGDEAPWGPFVINWIMNWLSNTMLAVVLVFYIKNLFYSWKST